MQQQTLAHRISGPMSELLYEFQGLELWLLGQDTLDEFNRFLYKVYNDAFAEANGGPLNREELEAQSALFFPRTRMCGVRHGDGTLLGTWGLIVKDLKSDAFQLPIESRYGISAQKIVEQMRAPETKYLFNGWRTAIDKQTLENYGIAKSKSILLFDLLLKGLHADFESDSKQYLGVAEMEMLVLKYHRRIGIPWEIIGAPIFFWGRDRFPCAFRLAEYKEYMKEHHPERFELVFGL